MGVEPVSLRHSPHFNEVMVFALTIVALGSCLWISLSPKKRIAVADLPAYSSARIFSGIAAIVLLFLVIMQLIS
jgi:hypothetical protein